MLPAYAGMIPGCGCGCGVGIRAPRVCGDDPDSSITDELVGEVLPAYAGMIRRG